MELSHEQQAILQAVLEGHNVFYTGPAGTGKSFMLQNIVAALTQQKKHVHLTAPTGMSQSAALSNHYSK